MEESGDNVPSTSKGVENSDINPTAKKIVDEEEKTSDDNNAGSNTGTSLEVKARDQADKNDKEQGKREKEIVSSKKSSNLKKRKYRLRSSKDSESDNEDSLMAVDASENKSKKNDDADVSVNSIAIKPIVTRSRKKLRKGATGSKNASSSKDGPITRKSKSSQSQETPRDNEHANREGTSVEQANENNSNSDSEITSRTSDSSFFLSESDSSLDSSKVNYDEEENEELTDDEEWLEKHTDPLGAPSWSAVKELYKRQYGCRSRSWQHKVRGSRGLVSRLDQQYTLDAHQGCVNALHFNERGTLLASGSDDLDINIWDFQSSDRKPFISYSSGHRSNVFQTKFMPNSNDLTVISCARDGQVRVGYLSSTGACRDTKKLAQHRGSAHKLSLDSAGSNSMFLSCGEDGVVMEIDLRENNPAQKIVTVKEDSSKVPLYSIHSSPRQPFHFAVSGRDEWARVYDRRMLSAENPETVAKYSPFHLQFTHLKANITCLMYNHDGQELLCSYNDDDIYLFDATHSSGDDFKRRFKGHRNSATVKGVNFYGPNSEFVVSGSDCGNVFLWDKASSQVIRFVQGDDGGVVNVLEPHPNLPILATSGLDNNIKIWSPIGDGTLDQKALKELMLSNRKERHDDSNAVGIDSQLLWFLMRSLRSRAHAGDDDGSSDHSGSGSSDSEGVNRRRVDCLPS